MCRIPATGMETVDTAEQDRADMERLAGGHDAALNALMKRHAGPVYQFLFRMLNDEEDADERGDLAHTLPVGNSPPRV